MPLALITLVMLSIAAQAQTNGPATAEGDGGTELTAEQRARFVEGAREVAGLSDEQIARVLENPELINDIPVDVSTSRTTTDTADPSTATASSDFQTQAAEECAMSVATIWYDDVNGEKLLQFSATKRWCTNWERVTYGNMNDVQTWVRADAQYMPETGGWRYVPSAEFGTEEFKSFDGRAYGAHKSTRAGKFEFFFTGDTQPDSKVLPAVIQTGRYDGICISANYLPKEPIIDSGPPAYTKSTSATFTFSHVDPNTTFECNRDGNGPFACSSPKTYESLAEGEHDFRIQAVNSAGNALPKPPRWIWTVDLTAPRVASVAPAVGATGVAANADVEAVFTEEVRAISVVGNLTLVKRGTTTPVEASLTYNPRTSKAALDPAAALEAGANYVATVHGGTGGVRDLAGNPLASDKIWSFTVAQ